MHQDLGRSITSPVSKPCLRMELKVRSRGPRAPGRGTMHAVLAVLVRMIAGASRRLALRRTPRSPACGPKSSAVQEKKQAQFSASHEWLLLSLGLRPSLRAVQRSATQGFGIAWLVCGAVHGFQVPRLAAQAGYSWPTWQPRRPVAAWGNRGLGLG